MFERLCLDETNIIYERFTFNRRDQAENEDFDKYLTALREQVRRCEFKSMEGELLRDRIVCGIRDNALRWQLLQKERLTIQGCIDMCRASEATARHLRVMGGEEDVHRVRDKPSRPIQPRGLFPKQIDEGKECPACGVVHSLVTDMSRTRKDLCCVR